MHSRTLFCEGGGAYGRLKGCSVGVTVGVGKVRAPPEHPCRPGRRSAMGSSTKRWLWSVSSAEALHGASDAAVVWA